MRIHRSRALIVGVLVVMTLPFGAFADAKIVVGNGGDNYLRGTNRRDTLSGRGGEDLLAGKRGNDVLKGGSNVLSLATGGGDILFLGAGYDIGKGGPGADVIVDDDGPGADPARADVMDGGTQDDIFAAADGGLTNITCGDGIDIALVDLLLDVASADCEVVVPVSGVTIGLFGTTLFGTGGDDTLNGVSTEIAPLPDLIAGKGGNDTINGGPHTDLAAGGPGTDVVNGDAGSDQLVDDDGTPGDTLNGGTEDDAIFSADGAIDTVNCGDGTDTVTVDKTDVVNADCETVIK